MKFGSLFSGIGGIDLGLERAGMNCVWQVEIDDYATRVLEKHWPEVTRYRDVKDVGVHNLEAVDLICGGFPCQDVSVAGKRAGLNGGRSTLWKEFYRIICELRPRWVLAENVPGLLSSDNGQFFGNILRDLAESGYDAEWNVLSAAAVGAPHKRDRVFIVAYPRQFAARVVCAGFGGGWQDASAASVFTTEARDGFANSSQTMADTAGKRLEGAKPKGTTQANGRTTERGQWTVEPNVGGATDGLPGWLDRFIGRGMSYAESKRAVETLRKLWNVDVSEALWRRARGLDRVSQAEVLFTFVREYEKNPDQARLFLEGAQTPEGELRGLRLSETVAGTSHQSGQDGQSTRKYTDAVQVVSQLSALDRETEWLAQSWEDGVPRVASGVKNRVDRLKCLGNAVVPQCAEYIGRMIMGADNAPGS